MGTAMLKPLKNKAEILMETLKGKLNEDFENNKKLIRDLNLPFSKSTVNKLAGYIARQIKKQKKEAK